MRWQTDCQPFFADAFGSGVIHASLEIAIARRSVSYHLNLPITYKLFTPLFTAERENQHHTREINSPMNSREQSDAENPCLSSNSLGGIELDRVGTSMEGTHLAE